MSLPFLTADLPGTGGRARDHEEDFVVEELPSYAPCGDGDHLYLLIEKRGITTHEAARRIARAVGVPARSVGFAGLKDARAVSRQTFSVEHVTTAAATDALGGVEGLVVREARHHKNKLRLGHLRGNRFTLRVRGTEPLAAERARTILDVLAQRGVPNWFGPQRFGVRGDNQHVGRLLVRGDAHGALRALVTGAAESAAEEVGKHFDAGEFEEAARALPPRRGREERTLAELASGAPPKRVVRALPRALLRLLVSAYQSHLFNLLVAERFPDPGRLETGDLAFLHARGAVFAVEDGAVEQPRADALEISPSAPLFGTRTPLATCAPGDRERALLAAEDLREDSFRATLAGTFRGVRRPVRVPVTDASADAEDVNGEACIVLRFALPSGSYATSVLHEIVKDRQGRESPRRSGPAGPS